MGGPPPAVAKNAHPPLERGLHRSIDAHSGRVKGVLPIGDRLVSWGADGALRFWSLDGAALAGGATDAHFGEVWGVQVMGDRLVSWGEDGVFRFWSLDGSALPGGVIDAHRGGFGGSRGAPPVGDRLVSWGETARSDSGALTAPRSQAGRPTPISMGQGCAAGG